MKIEVGVYRGNRPSSGGWLHLCEQEKLPHREICESTCPVLLCEGETPEWLEDFLRQGGTALVTEADPGWLPFPTDYRGQAVIETASFPQPGLETVRVPGLVNLFAGTGWGEFCVHEKRVTKGGIRQGMFPVFLRQEVGRGSCWYTGVPLTRLLTVAGDTLLDFSRFTEVTERVVAVDKGKVEQALTGVLRRAFDQAGLPYAHLWYYPDGAPTVFAFRIDADGVYGDNLVNISRVGAELGLPLTFFLNKSLCEAEVARLREIDPLHEIGNHGDVHNLFDTEGENLLNVRRCREWLDGVGLPHGLWYAAPRGMWNVNLGLALEELGYEYSSDFGLCRDGLPFFPRFGGRRSSLLQIPIHPYSVERAYVYAEEQQQPAPTAAEVLEYFLKVAEEKLRDHSPILLYSHPQRFGPLAGGILPGLNAAMVRWGVPITTITRFGRWWMRRDRLSFEADYDPQTRELMIEGELPEEAWLNVLAGDEVRVRSAAGPERLLSVA